MRDFIKGLGIVLGFSLLVVLAVTNYFPLAEAQVSAIGIGGVLALIYVLAGFVSFFYALRKNPKSFSRLVIISIFGRLLAITLAIILILKFAAIDQAFFLVTLSSFILFSRFGKLLVSTNWQ